MTETHQGEAGRYIRYEVADRVARITVDRPEYRNAQSRLLLEELDEAFLSAAQDPDVNVICLFGAGDHFSAGHDLGTPDELADRAQRPQLVSISLATVWCWHKTAPKFGHTSP